VRPVRRATRGPEVHLSHRSNWLRAAVLGANDGILSTSSLVLGVAASGASGTTIVVAGVAGLTGGALSMAAGEYVSVSSQRDSERADLRLEARELRSDPERELRELAAIYERRGLPAGLAREVALAVLGDRGARLGGAPTGRPTLRAVSWGRRRWPSRRESGRWSGRPSETRASP
jgi:VIT1/CCC1 family predicted Fe2+/Mn2+ transporter